MNLPISVTDTLKRRFLEAIDGVKVEPGRYKYVIVDERASAIMSSAGCYMADVLAREGTMYLENLEKRRTTQVPNVEAIYFVSPTEDSVRRVIRDFAVGKPPIYAAGHLFFLAGLDDKTFDHLRASTDSRYIKSLKELFLDFFAIESRVFSLGNRNAFFNLYSPNLRPQNLQTELASISKQLVSVCASLQINPIVSYHRSPDMSMQTSKDLAMTVQKDLDDYYKDQPRIGLKPPQLIILDRTMDPLTPIMHDFTYQAIAKDFLPMKDGNKYEYKTLGSEGQEVEKVAVLDENDNIFTEIRHKHFTDCMKYLKTNLDNFVAESMPTESRSGGQLDEIREKLAKLPQYQEKKEKFVLHYKIVDECMEILKNHKVIECATLEQALATGELANGEIPKSFDPEIAVLLDDPKVRMIDRLRLIMLFFITQASPQALRNQLFNLSKCIYNDREIANNLEFLGVNLDVQMPLVSSKKGWLSGLLQKKSTQEEDLEYDLPRYTPVIKSIIDGAVGNTLDREVYPHTLAPEELEKVQVQKTVRSLRSARPTFHQKTRRNETLGRLILFVAGGITESEIRIAYETAAAHKWDIIVGSTHVTTPPMFMDDMKFLRHGPPAPPPPPPRTPSPPPVLAARPKQSALSSVKGIFGSTPSVNTNTSPANSAGGHHSPNLNTQPTMPQQTSPANSRTSLQSSQSTSYKGKLKGLFN